MFGNIPKLNDDAHAAALKAARALRLKERNLMVHGAQSTAGGKHARVCRSI
jgi:hypothetical protein